MYEIITQKLQQQRENNCIPTLAFFDLDGTIFTGKPLLWHKDIFYNTQTAKIIKKNHIPLIIVTGRSQWDRKAKIIVKFFGLPNPDAVITAAGTQVQYLHTNQSNKPYQEKNDEAYQKILEKISWDKTKILMQANAEKYKDSLILKNENTSKFLIRFNAQNLPVERAIRIKQELGKNCSNSKVLIAEKLFLTNSLNIYNGDILIVPNTAGKDNAIKYLLTLLAKNNTISPLQAYIFGDACIDIDMLTMPSTKNYQLHQYGVNLTPLAEKELTEEIKKHPTLKISTSPGPKIINKILDKLEAK